LLREELGGEHARRDEDGEGATGRAELLVTTSPTLGLMDPIAIGEGSSDEADPSGGRAGPKRRP
jgi:hypothetical protein